MARANDPEELDEAEQQAEDEREEREYNKEVSRMVDDTERETFRSVFDGKMEEPEDDGDRSLEEPEEDISGEVPAEEQQASEDEQQQPQSEPQQEEQGEEEQEQDDGRFVPGYRFREQVRARQRLEQQLAELQARQQQPQYAPPPQQPYQPPPLQQQQKPDPFVDPDAHAEWQRNQTLLAARIQRIGESFAEAAEEHGDNYQYVYSVLNEALARNDPTALQVQNRILASPNPGRALMRWGQDLLQERADYQQQWIHEQVLNQYGIDLAELEQQQRSGQSAPRPAGNPQRRSTMPSLNSAAGNGRVMNRPRYDSTGRMSDNDEDIFNDIMSSPRR